MIVNNEESSVEDPKEMAERCLKSANRNIDLAKRYLESATEYMNKIKQFQYEKLEEE